MRPFLAPEVFRCPAAGLVNVSKTGPGFTDYVGTAGVGRQAWALSKDSPGRGVWNVDLQTGLDDITRGQSHVLLLIETARDNGPWTASATPTLRGFDPAGTLPIGGLGQFGGWHAGGANVVYVDGHMQFIGERIDPHIFSSLCLIARPD
jgi:prepilin-type processing-associated H-X9-DG protein